MNYSLAANRFVVVLTSPRASAQQLLLLPKPPQDCTRRLLCPSMAGFQLSPTAGGGRRVMAVAAAAGALLLHIWRVARASRARSVFSSSSSSPPSHSSSAASFKQLSIQVNETFPVLEWIQFRRGRAPSSAHRRRPTPKPVLVPPLPRDIWVKNCGFLDSLPPTRRSSLTPIPWGLLSIGLISTSSGVSAIGCCYP